MHCLLAVLCGLMVNGEPMNLTIGQRLGRLIDDSLRAHPGAKAFYSGRRLSTGGELAGLVDDSLRLNTNGVGNGKNSQLHALNERWDRARDHANSGLNELDEAHIKTDHAGTYLAKLPQVGVIPKIADWIAGKLAPVIHGNKNILSKAVTAVMHFVVPMIAGLVADIPLVGPLLAGTIALDGIPSTRVPQLRPVQTDADSYSVTDPQSGKVSLPTAAGRSLLMAGRPLAYVSAGVGAAVLSALLGRCACAKLKGRSSFDRVATFSELQAAELQ